MFAPREYQFEAVEALHKKCTKCGIDKSVEFFHRNKNGRYGVDSICKSCKSEYQKMRKDKCNESCRKYYRNNKRKCIERHRRWRSRNRKHVAEYSAINYERRRFSFSLSASKTAAKNGGYKPCSASEEEIRIAFTGECQICGIPESECNKRLHMDHNHETGEFRGWLCSRCNKLLGFSGDSIHILTACVKYLENAKCTN